MSYSVLTCPFCANVPALDTRKCEYENSESTAWAHIRCNMCAVRPMASGSRSNGYMGTRPYLFIRCHTNEEALKLAIEEAIRVWNIRARVDCVVEIEVSYAQ